MCSDEIVKQVREAKDVVTALAETRLKKIEELMAQLISVREQLKEYREMCSWFEMNQASCLRDEVGKYVLVWHGDDGALEGSGLGQERESMLAAFRAVKEHEQN